MRRSFGWLLGGAAFLLTGCGSAPSSAGPSPSGLQVFASSATQTPVPTPVVQITAAAAQPTAVAPTPTVTPGPLAYVVTFATERRDYTLHVGDEIRLELTAGPSGDWMSGVDDVRVLAPMSPQANGVYQAIAPGTTLLTAHVLYGCANVTTAVHCSPENGLWYQTRVYVLP
ncbi:MAG: hypothetical protein JO247_05915 [Chloroflexi bacterium]|nr:hypothetical protein [Chloroflexota bacterium]